MYHVTKHYPHSLGLSACFRQQNADSHCRFPHGYALAFTFEFAGRSLDKNHWLIDFGKLKPLKEWLTATFDHTILISKEDTVWGEMMADMQDMGNAKVITLPHVGMEAFAEMAFERCLYLLKDMGESSRVRLTKVTVAEHEGNSASYSEPL